MIFDTHAHYDDEDFDTDREQLLASFPENGISYVVNVGADMESSASTIALTRKYPFVYGAVGVHPSNVNELDEEAYLLLSSYCDEDKILAVGEIGLDYYWDSSEKELQKEWFARQLVLADMKQLPVIIHSRDAAADTLEVLRAELRRREELHGCRQKYQGVMHCFSYSAEIAREVIAMGFYLGIGGVITFKNARKLVEVVEEIDLEHIVLETDCPYLAPVPYRAKRNSSLYLPYVVEKIAQIKGLTIEEVIEITTRNAKDLYRMNK